MLIGGFIAAVAALVVMLICFFSNLDMFSRFGLGFGKWLDLFFANITPQKVCFFIAVAVFVIGLYCYFAGKAKAKKAGDDSTKFVPAPIAKYFRDTKGEFKKITWPTFKTVVRNTGVTLVACILLGLVICLFDFGLGALINLFV